MPIAALSRVVDSADAAVPPQRTLAPSVLGFLASLQNNSAVNVSAEVPVIHVSSVVSSAAVFYERLRYSLDYREEHLLRRHAIERMLRRRADERIGFRDFARFLLIELVQAQYLKNDAVPETMIPLVQEVLDRYAVVLAVIEADPSTRQAVSPGWLLGLLAAELDDTLAPSPADKALVDLMVSYVTKDNPLEGWSLTKEELETQIFIACYRALFAFDPPTIHYLLLLKHLPHWRLSRASDVAGILDAFFGERLAVEKALRHPANSKLYRTIKSQTIVFHSLKDVALQHPGGAQSILLNEAKLSSELEATCRRYYQAARRRLYRSAIRSTIYIFLTKITLALIVEVPAEQYLFGIVAAAPLVINTVFPPTLMFFLTVTTRFPGASNTRQVLGMLTAFIYGGEKRLFSKIKPPSRSSTFSGSIFFLLFLLMFAATFGGIIWALRYLHFTFIGIGFFLFFLTVVSFFAIRVRQPVRNLFVVGRRENILVVLINFFSLPILRVGQWVSLTSARFNVFLFLFDYLLEAPFKSFLILFEDVLGFFREKREDII